jgi:hypothetical protein
MLNSDTDFFLFETQSDGSMPATTQFTITPSAGTGGIIGPNTNQPIILGRNITFTITPNNNYQISNVIVDGNDVGAVSTYTIPDVQANHNITANFSLIVWSITTSAGNGGSINPNSTQTINNSSDIVFIINPNSNYVIGGVTINGKSVGATASYLFHTVSANYAIAATFTYVPPTPSPTIASATTNNPTTNPLTIQ